MSSLFLCSPFPLFMSIPIPAVFNIRFLGLLKFFLLKLAILAAISVIKIVRFVGYLDGDFRQRSGW